MKQKRLLALIIPLIVISFVLTTLVSLHSLRTVIKGNDEEFSKVLTSQIYDTINNRLTDPIAVAQTMSVDYFLTESMKSDDFPTAEQEKTVVRYLKNISETMNYSSVNVISEKSGKYYTQDGFNKIIDPENDAHDVRYTTFLDTGKKLDLNIDTDEAHGDQWTVFYDARIEDRTGELLGVCSVSVVMTDLQDILKEYVDEYGVNINLISEKGNIEITASDVSVEKAVLSTELQEYQGNSDYIYEDLGSDGYRVRKYMDNLDLLLIVTKEVGEENQIYVSLVYRNLLIFLVIMVILIFLVASNINYDKKRTKEYTRKIEEYAKEQENLKAQAESASNAKGDFLANMSHEIRTPINAVLGFDEMILRESEEENVLSYAANIKSSGRALLSLINDILDFSKIESGKMDIVPVEYDTVSVISELMDMIRPRAEAKGLLVKTDISGELPVRLFGDDVRIRQVITNLMTNAVKYTEEGSVTLSLSAKKQGDKETILHVSVKDTGIGIKEEDQGRLFDAFQRVDEKKNRTIEGTGLGLSITTRILDLMGSKLMLSSVYGEGSDFSFDLVQGVIDDTPIGDFKETVKDLRGRGEKYTETFKAPNAKILVVDDLEMNLLVFCGLLKKTEIRIDMAQSGSDAIDHIRNNDYDLIFMDHMMPDMDGIETLCKMKEEFPERIAGVPVVALTANAISGAREMHLLKGFSDYLTKPVDGMELEKMCIRLLPETKVQLVSCETGINNEAGGDEDPDKEEKKDGSVSAEWYEGLEGIDGKAAIKNSGSKEAFTTVLKIFYDSIDQKSSEIEGFYKSEDWDDYTIKVHALKSAARLVGALNLGEHAQRMETAGKEADIDYIRANYDDLMSEYRQYKVTLAPVFGSNNAQDEDLLPVAEASLMESFYETVKTAAANMDTDLLESALEKMKDYSIPKEEKETYEAIKECFDQFDYDGISEAVSTRDKRL